MTVKAKIETVRVEQDGERFTLQVSFPGFKGPAGDPVAMTFETTLGEYQGWVPPGGVAKTPESYVEYKYVRPTYAKLQAIHAAIDRLEGKEYDW